MSRRLSTDAKIVLERAGYSVTNSGKTLQVRNSPSGPPSILRIVDGTVNNESVTQWLAQRGFDASGYPST